MRVHHIAIWTFRLEELRNFYIRYFSGKSNEKYINPKKGFESYFIYFDEGPSLELMSRTDVQNTLIEENRLGLTHFALAFQSKEDVLKTTEQLRADGYTIAGEPRTSGDGYFESVILDPDGLATSRKPRGITGSTSFCILIPERGMGHYPERQRAIDWLHRHHRRPQTRKPASTYAGILARRGSMGKRLYDGGGKSGTKLRFRHAKTKSYHR